MKTLVSVILILISSNFNSQDWKPGKTDSDGNLIIVEMKKEIDNKRPIEEIISVDMKWSVVIEYPSEDKQSYYIFNNETKQIFSTKSFEEFLNELQKIPDNTTIRKIGKCTAPFDYEMPPEKRGQISELIKKKNCILEDKLMFCYCGAVKMNYPFIIKQ